MTEPNGAAEGGSGGSNNTYTRSELQTAQILIEATAKAPSSSGAEPIPAPASAEAESTSHQAVALPSTTTIEKDSTSKEETTHVRVVPVRLPSILPGAVPVPLPASQRVPIPPQAANFPAYYNYSYSPYLYHNYHLPILLQARPLDTATDIIKPSQKSTHDKKSKSLNIPKKKKRTIMRRDSEESKEAAGGVVEDGKEKSERKRQREKQRRSELTNAFEDMHSFIVRLDTDHGGDGGGEGATEVNHNNTAAEDNQNNNNNNNNNNHADGSHTPTHRRKNRRLSSRNAGGGDGDDGAMTTRVDLINRALTIMKRMYQENAEMKQALARTGGGPDKNNEVWSFFIHCPGLEFLCLFQDLFGRKLLYVGNVSYDLPPLIHVYFVLFCFNSMFLFYHYQKGNCHGPNSHSS